ncbi:MAG TPA: hypothetical protein VHK91_12405, partial [Flavisolibacter sp.]|nr:hypothetical protein [Flavisolibacter sp.]
GFLAGFQHLPFFFMLFMAIPALLIDIDQFRESRRNYQFIPTAISLVLILVVIGRMLFNSYIDHSNTLFTLNTKGGAKNDWQMEFKANGHFLLLERTRLSLTTFSGTYNLNGDTILLVSSNYDHKEQLPYIGYRDHDRFYWNGNDTMVVNDKEGNIR